MKLNRSWRRRIIWTAILLSPLHLWGQQIDSLEQLIARPGLPDTVRINTLNLLARELTFIDPARSASYAEAAMNLSVKKKYTKGEADSYRILSSLFSSGGFHIIAEVYIGRSLDLFETLNDSAGIANCFITMGHSYRRNGNRELELEYHRKAYEYFSRQRIPERKAITSHNLGETYQRIGEPVKSRALTEQAISLLTGPVQNKSVLSNCYKVMGKLELADGNTKGAEQYFLKALAISEELGKYSQKNATIESIIALADINRETGQGFYWLEKARDYSMKNLVPGYLDKIFVKMIELRSSNLDSVRKYSREYLLESDSLNKMITAHNSKLARIEIGIYHRREEERKKLEKELITKEHRIRSKNQLLIVLLVSGLSLMSLLIMLARSLRRQKKGEEEIRMQAAQLRELAARLQNIREEERSKLAYEVHEGLGQKMVVVKMEVLQLKNFWVQSVRADLAAKADETLKLLDDNIDTIRKLAEQLRPGMLDDIGLDVAIKWQLAEFEKGKQVKTSFNGHGDLQNITRTVTTGLFRIFQEALENTAMHANASRITVNLYRNEKEIVLTIDDDGSGFDKDEVAMKKNLGFLSMQERSYMLNGLFEVSSFPGKGTCITVKIPLQAFELRR